MSKTSFLDRFEKAQQFFDTAYHHHKATYKGLGQFFSNYAETEKNYANSLLWQSQCTSSCIPDITKQQPSVQLAIREICNNLEKVSQLHHNFGQRLRDIGEYCKQEYSQSKKTKEKIMKAKFQKSQEQHEKVKIGKDRDQINLKQKQICSRLYDGLQEYMEDELSRTQKLKEQIIIYFSLSKKIAERQIELTSTYNLKMIQFEIDIEVKQLEQVEGVLVEQYNGYGKDQLQRKNRQIAKQMVIHRQSLRDSIFHKERAAKVDETLTKMAKIVQKYKTVPQELNYPKEDDYLIGIFDKRVISNYRQYSGQFKSEALKQIAFAWLSSFYLDTEKEDEAQSILTVAKANLKVRHIKVSKASNAQIFIDKFMQKCQNSHRSTLWFLVQLSQVYEGTLRISQLDKALPSRSDIIQKGLQHPIHWKIGLVLVDSLIDSVIIVDSDESILYDEYLDILRLIVTFSKDLFNIPSTMVISLLLRKLQRVFSVTASDAAQRLEELFNAGFDLNDQFSQTQELKMHICHRIINYLTKKMSFFYKSTVSSFSNLAKMSMAVQLVLPKNYFTASEHMHSCIKMAGFNFFEEMDEDGKVLKDFWQGEARLKNLTESLEQLQLEKINKDYLEPIANELSKVLGVGQEVVLTKMKKQFSLPISEIVQCNLEVLNEQEGVDKEGYVLRLGICLAGLDLQQPQPLSSYELFFTVLSNYLSATEKEYDQLLEHARKTELWIVQQNSQATQNCIDFCSLLYKPFEFLLTSLKKLQGQNQQTQFTQQYSHFIKLKLNTALKGQIQKYVKFLDVSLNNYIFREPQLLLKYKRLTTPYVVTNEQITKERFLFKEVTRRYFNLFFLKNQLDEIVCDFIDRSIYQDIDRSIFNLESLRKAAEKYPNHQAILTNIYSIAVLISNTEESLMSKISSITVYFFMRRIFANLYYQEEKGFFANDKDYKLSEYTFVRHQNEIEQLFLSIRRNIPSDILEKFSKEFCSSMCKAYRVELLDANKFKIPIRTQRLIEYLKADLNFLCNIAKQKFISASFVKEHLEEPCLKFLHDLEKPNQKVMDAYSQANVKNNMDQARYCLCLLNLRKDTKSEEFVQRYKNIFK